MKIVTLLLLFLGFTLGSQAQKCRYISNTVSGLDGTLQVITQPELFASNSVTGKVEIWAKLHRDSVIVLAIVLHGDEPLHLFRDDSIVFFQNENSILNLKVLQDAYRPEGVVKPLTVYALVGQEDLAILKYADTDALLLGQKDGRIKIEATKPKFRKAISHVLGCVCVFLKEE